MKLSELKEQAEGLRKAAKFSEALPLYNSIYENEKSEWNAYRLVQCFRKNNNLEEAKNLNLKLFETYPNSKYLRSESYWIFYYLYIKDCSGSQLVIKANILISRIETSRRQKELVYFKTVIYVVNDCISASQFIEAYNWLNRIDWQYLYRSIGSTNGIDYLHYTRYYINILTEILIKAEKILNYIEKYLNILKFHQEKVIEFKKEIYESLFYNNEMSRSRIYKLLYSINKEVFLKNNPKHRLAKSNFINISEIGHFVFCPVSYAINKSIDISSNLDIDKEKSELPLITLLDRYNLFKKNKKIEDCFTDFLLDESQVAKFGYIFDSDLRVNNSNNPKPTIYRDITNSIQCAPDYIFENSKGVRFTVIEKFSKMSSTEHRTSSPFPNDLIKMSAILSKFSELKLEFGLFLTWFWDYDSQEYASIDLSISKKKIQSCGIHIIKSSEVNHSLINKTLLGLNEFINTGKMVVDGRKISAAKKCLSCSVENYCQHKTGNLDAITLPYRLSPIENEIISLDFNLEE